jgi:SAM-dependent methyltransferase
LLARAYPQASVHGYDFHDRSIQVARQRAAQADLGGRIRFEPLDAISYPADGFDLICLLDTLHDLGDPAAALAHAGKALAPDGAVLVVERHSLQNGEIVAVSRAESPIRRVFAPRLRAGIW